MGFFDTLRNMAGGGGGSGPPCPDCGVNLVDEWGGGRYECHNDDCSGSGVIFEKDGVLFDPNNPSRRGHPGDGRTCEACQSSLSGGDDYLPYEDGSNAQAYIVCRSCGHQNTVYGFGGDDD